MQWKHYRIITSLFVYILFLIPSSSWANNIVNQIDTTESPYRKAGNFIYISAQSSIPSKNPAMQSAVFEDEVQQTFENLKNQVSNAGATMNDVVKITVYMTNVDLILDLVKKYIPEYFKQPYPARSIVGGLSFGWGTGINIMIDAVVYVPN